MPSTQDPVSGRWYAGRRIYTLADAEREREEIRQMMRRRRTWWGRIWRWLRTR